MASIENFLSIGLRTRTPGLILGEPGIGKSASVVAWAKANNMRTWVVIASLREPTDFAGLPVVTKRVFKDADGNEFPSVCFAPPRFATEAYEHGGLIFLDELTTAPPAVQAALLRAVLDRSFGDLDLDPDRVAIMAAANPPELASGGWDLSAPLANRFRHRRFNLDPKQWTEDFPTYWKSPPTLGFGKMELKEEIWSRARSQVAGFLRTRPTKLLEVPKEEANRSGAWPSPRSWDFASRQLAAIIQDNLPPTEALPYIIDCVGEGIANEFVVWLREADLPDPWELLKKPDSFKMPNRTDVAFAILTSVATAAVSNLTVTNWNAAWKILGIVAKGGAKDIAATASRILAENHRANLPHAADVLEMYRPLLKAANLYPGQKK